jgi:hypothetical protein
MAKKKAAKKRAKRKPKEALKSNPNPNHKEDFDKVLEMLIPRVKPKGIKSNNPLED